MFHLKDLKTPFLLSALILGLSFLELQKVDFYAVFLAVLYFIFALVSKVGGRYMDETRQKESSKRLFKFFVDPTAALSAALGLFYAYAGEFHWIFIGIIVFLGLILYTVTFSDWLAEKEKEKQLEAHLFTAKTGFKR